MSIYLQPQTKTASKPSFSPVPSGLLQRKCACGGSADLDGECEECRKKRMQRRSANGAEPATVPPIVNEVLRLPGQPLDPATRAFMEPRFGHDFSKVRVHTDSKGAESARAVSALAYTVGQDVVFRVSQYAPGTSEGRQLLAHELTHVVQQQQQQSSLSKLRMVESNDPSEHEASAVASAVMEEHAPDSLQSQPAQVARDEETTNSLAESSSGGRIYPIVKVWINSFIPQAQISGPPGSECFTGDDRSFSNDIHASSRTHQEIEVSRPGLTPTINWKHIGTSHEVDCDTGRVLESAIASTDELTNGPIRGGRTSADLLISFSGAASNPLVTLAPAIDFSALFRINLVTRRCDLEIEHDGFPAYEAYITADDGAGVSIYSYDPIAAGEGIIALFPPMDKSGNVRGISF